MNIDQGRVGRRLNLASKMIVGIGQILTQIKERRNLIYLILWNRCISEVNKNKVSPWTEFDSIATVGEIRVYWRADFQSGSRVLKKVF